ncbi:MAG: OmpA family protein [Bacteriovoracaceae bacterium]|jgi:outer membrane protein OmpA-like peptidoglycan-associated protein|nr:OmpA family protein [Bacteriovoracaceae bacterium]
MKTWTFLFISLLGLSAYGINLQKFHFSNSPTFATLEDGILDEGLISNDYKYILVGSYNYVRAPFVEIDNNNRSQDIISWMHTFNLGGAYKFNKNLQLGLSTFFTYQNSIPYDSNSNDEEKDFSLGDTTIDLKYKFFEKSRLAVAFTPRLYIPTGEENAYLSTDEIGYYLGFALDKAFSFFQLAINLGHKANTGAIYEKNGQIVDHESQFHFSVGALIPLVGNWDFTAEFFRDTPYESNNVQAPSEGSVGLRYGHSTQAATFLGVGAGSTNEDDANDLRIYAGYKYFPSGKEKSEKVKREEKKFGRIYKLFNIYFETGKFDITDIEMEKLKEMKKDIANDPYISKIVIEGYASTVGSVKINKYLGKKRAQEVTAALIKAGVSKDIIEVVSYGNEKADKQTVNKNTDRKVMFRVYRKR